MCFVLDTNSFHLIFDPSSQNHSDFKPLLKWLYKKPKTSLVFGGKKYRTELSNIHKYDYMLVELKRKRKLKIICDEIVDDEEKRIRKLIKCKNFDDQHIVAIFCASGCMIFASKDSKADKYIKDHTLYPNGQKPPSIYRYAHQANDLLRDSNIVRLRNVVK